MRENYQEFLSRIHVFEKRNLDLGKSYFKGRPSLAHKIDENNKLKSFFGDTVVFELDDHTKERINNIFFKIYNLVPECFSERLDPKTLHMTLHDLSNSPDRDSIACDMESNFNRIQLTTDSIKKEKIKMRTSFIFNMVNTSLVLGLVPEDEYEFNKLMRLYYIIDNIKQAEYPLTPHITLSYYNINGFSEEAKNKLEDIVFQLNNISEEVILDTDRLFYQRFYSMNEYHNILKLTNT